MQNFDYTGNIILNEKYNNRRQSLYASQSYGTFYSLFGKFEVKDFSTNSTKLKSLNLELINYKGLLNMEIAGYKLDSKVLEGDKKVIILTVLIQAATVKRAETVFHIKESDLSSLEINQEDIFLVRRELLSIYGESKEQLDRRVRQNRSGENEPLWQPLLGGIFDNEFFYRNGQLLEKRKDGDFALIKSSEASSGINNAPAMIFDGTPSCHMRGSLINLI